MYDLISRQAAIDIADSVWSATGDKNVAKVWDQISNLPSAEVPDKKIGKWINRLKVVEILGMSGYADMCNICRNTVIRLITSDDFIWEFYYHYCPNCGAKMEENNET